MEDEQERRRPVTLPVILPATLNNEQARESVLGYYARSVSSYATDLVDPFDNTKVEPSKPEAHDAEGEAGTQEEPHTEPFPDYTDSGSDTITESKLTPPKRPSRPRGTTLSWIQNNTGNPWTNISLNPTPPQGEFDWSDIHRRTRSAAPSSYFPRKLSFSSASEKLYLEKGNTEPSAPVGFFDSSFKKERRRVIGRWCIMTLGLCAFIMGILSLYWAATFNVNKNLDRLTVYVVNFESQSDALIGPLVTSITEGIVHEHQVPRLGFVSIPPATFGGDHMAVREAIWQEHAWAAIVVNSNATQMLRQAIGFSNSSYDPNGAIQLIYNEARSQDLYFDHIYPMMQLVQTQILTQFGQKWTQELMSNDAVVKTSMRLVPQAVNPGIGFSTYNLRPFLPYTAVPAVSIGLIYLIIISFFSFSFYMPIHAKLMKGSGHPPIKFWHFVVWRWFATMLAYLFLSLAYSSVSLAFGFPFSNGPGSHYITELTPSKFYEATFFIYWMINFFGMIALGLACENMSMFLGTPWTALWLIFWVVTNVSTAFYDIELEAGFYNWGYAWPLHNVVEASRTTLFDLHSNLPINFGILIGWGTINTLLFPAACLYLRRKMAGGMVGKTK